MPARRCVDATSCVELRRLDRQVFFSRHRSPRHRRALRAGRSAARDLHRLLRRREVKVSGTVAARLQLMSEQIEQLQ